MAKNATANKRQPELAHCHICGRMREHKVTILPPAKEAAEKGRGKPAAVSVFDWKRSNLVETRCCLVCGCTHTIRTDDPVDWPDRSSPKSLDLTPEPLFSKKSEPAPERRFCTHCDKRTIHIGIDPDDPRAPPAETNEFMTLAPEAKCWDCGTVQYKVIYHKEIAGDDISLYRNNDLKRLRRGR